MTAPRTLRDGYRTHHPWPEDCFVQCGGRGIVFTDGGRSTYRTAFFEAFPTNPQTFIRGEGATVADAEDAAWAKFERVSKGDHTHEYEARGYKNGAGFCKHCGLFSSKVFTPQQLGLFCVVCGAPTYWCVIYDDVFCERHEPSLESQNAMRAEARRQHSAPMGAGVGALPTLFGALLDDRD